MQVTAVRHPNLAALCNLLVPGAGLMLADALLTGVVVGLLFVVSANIALWGTLLIPDELAPWLTGLSIGVAAGRMWVRSFGSRRLCAIGSGGPRWRGGAKSCMR